MSARPTLAADQTDITASMNVFERYLTLWVCLCIVTGIMLGVFKIINASSGWYNRGN
jgi:ACR3 family arsenite efflux pump ArsB